MKSVNKSMRSLRNATLGGVIFFAALISSTYEVLAAPPQKIDFQYTDGLFGSYRLVATAKTIELRAGPRVVNFDIKKCNQKLIDVYLGRVRKSLGQLRVATRENPANRVEMNKKTYRVVLSSPAAPMLRNLPSETYYLSRLQSDLCRKGRVPSSEGDAVLQDPQGIMTKLDQINSQLELKPSSEPSEKCLACEWNKLIARKDLDSEVHDCTQAICGGSKSAALPDASSVMDALDRVSTADSDAAKEFEKEYAKGFGSSDEQVYAHGQCKMAYAVMVSLAPTQEQLNKIKAAEADIRGILKSKVKPEWKISYPEKASEVKTQFASQLRARGAKKLLDFCSTTVQLSNPEELSRDSVANEVVAREVIARKFGHLIYSEMKGAKEFEDIRRCLALKHKGESGDFTEEDFADEVAHLANPRSKANYWCSNFRNPDPEFDLYANGESKQSTDLFRLLHAEHARAGGLPNSCKKMLKAGGADIDFSPCM